MRAVGSDEHLARRRATVGEERCDGPVRLLLVVRELLGEVDPVCQAGEQEQVQRLLRGEGGEEIGRQALFQPPSAHRVDRDPVTKAAVGIAALRLVKCARYARPAQAVCESETTTAGADN